MVAAAALAALPAVGWADVLRWTNTSNAGNWFDEPSNWQVVSGPSFPPRAPGPNDTAVFDASATYTVEWDNITGHPTNQHLNVAAGNVTFYSNGGPFSYTLTGNTTISGSALNLGLSAPTRHLLDTLGTLDVRTGGTFNVRFGSEATAGVLMVGTVSGAAGTVLVDGIGSSFIVTTSTTHRLGWSGSTGTLTLQNGASGSIAGALRLAESTVPDSKGNLSVLSGSTLTLGSITAGVGVQSGQSGIINLQGDNSSITQTGFATLTIGSSSNSVGQLNIGTVSGNTETIFTTGTGNITINATGSITIGGTTLAQRGTFNANGNIILNGGTLIRRNVGALNLATGRTLTASNNALVSFIAGYSIRNGNAFTIQSGSQITSTEHVSVGDFTPGSLLITGAGSSLTANTPMHSWVGADTTGTLTIQNSGTATYAGSLFVGAFPGGDGTVSVSSSALLRAGSFFVGGNDVAPTAGVGTINITNGGRLRADNTLKLWPDGQLSLSDPASRLRASVFEIAGGEFTRTTGGVVVSDVITVEFGEFEIGRDTGHGLLSITNGGVLNNNAPPFTSIHVGTSPASTGQVTVSGAGSQLNNTAALRLGREGQGTLNVEAGGSVNNSVTIIGDLEGSQGTATISGAGSILNNNEWIIIGSEGTGTLNLQSGGWATNTTGYVGITADGAGTVTVTNPGSRWTNTGSLYVGGHESSAAGQGTVNVSNNGWLLVDGEITIWDDGQVHLTGSGSRIRTSTLDIVGGQFTRTDINALIVSSTIVGSIQNFFEIGRDGGTGTVNVTAGGTLSNSGEAWMAMSATSTGNATVSGPGSTWSNGNLAIGQFGTATLNIANGGQVSSANGYVGFFFSGNGTATVTGSGSQWINTGSLYVGGRDDAAGGTGTINVEDAGRLTVGTLKLWNDGTVHLTGTGSRITTASLEIAGGEFVRSPSTALIVSNVFTTVPNFFYVGLSGGTGTVSVTAGGLLNNNNAAAEIGVSAGSTGLATVSGSGSAWTNNSGTLTVGSAGAGTLNVEAGGSVTSHTAFIGRFAGAVGTVLITGAGSNWNNTSAMYLAGDFFGPGGSATVTVADGGALAAGSLIVLDSGIVNYNGGTTSAPTIDLTGGGKIVFGAGADKTLTTNNLSIDVPGGSFIDLSDNELIVNTTPLATIHGHVASSYNLGAWDGFGINSSAAATESGRALGVAPEGSGTRVAFAWAGDANLDGVVNIADLSLLATNWQRGVDDGNIAYWFHGDFNYDGKVNIADLSILASNWQAGVSADAPAMSFADALAMFDVFSGVVIPEPAALSLLGFAGILMSRGRQRRQPYGMSAVPAGSRE